MINGLRKRLRKQIFHNIKYLGVTLTKQVKDKNIKSPKKGIEQYTRRKNSHAHGSVGLT